MKLHIPGIEQRPSIESDLSNWGEVAEWYTEHGPNVDFQRGFFSVMDKLTDPHVVMSPEVAEKIRDHIAEGKPVVWAMSHHTWFDPSNDAAAMWQRRDTFDEAIGKFIVPARMDYFDMPVIGSIIATGGAKPVARKKDMAHYYAAQGLPEEEIAARLDAIGGERKGSNKIMQGSMADMALNGLIYASYAEGTRNRGDQTQLQPIRGGIENLLKTMDNPEDVLMVCMGHDYGGGRFMKRFLTPTIYIDAVNAPADPDQVNAVLSETLQGCIDGAIENRREGSPLSPLGKAAAIGAVAGGAAIANKLMNRR